MSYVPREGDVLEKGDRRVIVDLVMDGVVCFRKVIIPGEREVGCFTLPVAMFCEFAAREGAAVVATQAPGQDAACPDEWIYV